MVRRIVGVIDSTATRDTYGAMEYGINTLVEVEYSDGPQQALLVPGLPLPGAPYVGIGTDVDLWAFCTWDASVKPVVADEPGRFYTVQQSFKHPTFSGRGSNNSSASNGDSVQRGHCKDGQFPSPLLEPQKVSGGFNKQKIEATFDRFGLPVANSAFEPLRGSAIEFDDGRSVISIEQNVAILQLALLDNLINHVNSGPMWGLGRRSVKFSSYSWEAKFYGLCFKYYTRKLEFETNYLGFDRDVLDEGTKAINGKFDTITGDYMLTPIGGLDPDPTKPSHFCKFADRKGNPCRVILDGSGYPADVNIRGQFDGTGTSGTGTLQNRPPGSIFVSYYPETNLFALGIPTNF
jgi:hypothetical protein